MTDHIDGIIAGMSEAQKRNLLALPSTTWATVAEMRPKGATGSGMDILFISYLGSKLCERRWAKWGGEIGQKKGEGYEYRLTEKGQAVRARLEASNG